MTANDQEHFTTAAHNVPDLAAAANTGDIGRSAKLPDSYIGSLAVPGTVRWVIVAQWGVYYRMKHCGWESDFGDFQSCNANDMYSGVSEPGASPQWHVDVERNGACGGLQYGGSWCPLSGIHNNDDTYMGGYTGACSLRKRAPSKYVASDEDAGDGQWHQPGFVFVREPVG